MSNMRNKNSSDHAKLASESRPGRSGAGKFNLQLEARDKRYLTASLVLHLVVAIILLSSWEFSDSVEIKPIPSNIQARVLSAEELKQLNAKKLAEQKAIDDARKKEQEKKRQEKNKREELKKKEARKKAEAKKRAEAKKKEEARKKALIAKKEKEKKKKQEAERRRKLEEQKQAEQKKLKEKLRQDQIKKEEREKRLAERLKAADELAAQQAKQREADALLSAQREAAAARELDEKDRFLALIRSKIENRWHIPPHIKNMSVSVRIRLLPNGELSSASIVDKSGSAALDQSALNAIQSVRKFPVPDDKAIFEKYFRQFTMRFSPERE